MQPPNQPQTIESRWPVALTIVVVLMLLAVLPDRIRLVPVGVPALLAFVVLSAMALVPLSGGRARALRMERWVVLLFCLIAGVGTLISLAYLIDEMINHSTELGGLQLLTSSLTVWIDNVLLFSLLYWQIDLGGPEARLKPQTQAPDWLFPQADLADLMPHWRPTYMDYLFLAYTTAAAFSPTDALPLTTRAKLWMMLESSISLATILVVVSRAINILGS
jgi:uncharacterized membrane protein